MYKQIYGADLLKSLKGFKNAFLAAPDLWKPLYDDPTPENMLNDLPGEFAEKSDF